MNDDFLSIEAYNRNALSARVTAAYPALRAFAPTTFSRINFPSSISDEIELRRYADIMYELLDRQCMLDGVLYSPDEGAAMVRLSDQVKSLTCSRFGSAVQPLMCLFPPIPILRMIKVLSDKVGRHLRVFEVGPGSGYLGAYLINAGHQYIAMDNCQALYLWQNRLFKWISPDLCEWAGIKETPAEITASVTHIPWWHFARLHKRTPFSADIFICDAAMGEMDHFGLRYITRIAQAMLIQSDVGVFMFQNLGEERLHSRADVNHLLTQLGFKKFQIDSVAIFVTGKNDAVANNINAMTTLPTLGLSQPANMKSASAYLNIDTSKLLESYAFFRYIGFGN